MKVALVVPSAGSGRRLKTSVPKPFVAVAGKPLLIHTLKRLVRNFRFDQVVVAVEARQTERVKKLLRRFRFHADVVAGGKTRAESVYKAVSNVKPSVEWVLVHDAARPWVTGKLVRRVLNAARKTGAAICGLPATATVKKINIKNNSVIRTEDRNSLILVQTPQVFRKDLLEARYRRLGRGAFRCTDEAALFDGTKINVKVAAGEARNLKITTPEDLEFFRKFAS